MNKRPELPIGLQSFSELRTRNMLYVDKTPQIHRLISTGKYYFLSRPRRFGKSLTLSTIDAVYEGKRELFSGLWIEDQWDWNNVHPVVQLSINKLDYQGKGLEVALQEGLQYHANRYQLALLSNTAKSQFAELLEKLATQYGKVVLLIDEYDKPLIDYLDDIPLAKANQQVMKTFYSVIKDSDPYLEFLLITGVSKFSKVSIFSDLNHLKDLTFDRHAAALTGYTQAELEHYFTPYMPEAEDYQGMTRPELLDKLREWYNGYSWDGRTRVYNPFSILNFFSDGQFRNYWFETGTPTFLLKLLREQNLYKLDNLTVHERTFASYDIEYLQALPILFQTGYLTIKAQQSFGLYTLDYPNSEVRESLLDYIISDLRCLNTPMSSPMVVELHQAFAANDLERVIKLVKSIFKTIPSHIFIAKAEHYYHSLIYLVFFYLGQYTDSEVNTNDGRLDCLVKTPTHIYVIEFKLDKSADKAMQQIKDKGYAEKYRADSRSKVLVGINFSSETTTVKEWKTEVLV
ncbi:PD-(D/E)XK nuclease superfamily protein [Thiothrix caldifontis]|uniref:PD-(D/E)XK nuclease superfamily protein n=1 Tax=Thiothrix caldifontis TaxID=525918 RepID=A0A1H4GJX6_9GAMM|nr:ATP-binding protein [Thiothrix caldifontis]SEB08972.1 PD-(D/E)XK nuclease superfamily protein [Thiothrix caldifontis]